jgi:uncharacterized protein
METATDVDQTWLKARLGRTARGLRGVAVRRADGMPAVIVTDPLVKTGKGKVLPFPTVYWLVCPDLATKLARLEMVGEIARLQAVVDASPDLHAGINADHEAYIQARSALLSEADQLWLAEHPAIREQMESAGIAGMADRLQVKCFHAQYAFHLVRPTVVGKLIQARLLG